jgi:hypothetical protein
MKNGDAHWKIKLLHILQEVRTIYKTRNQLSIREQQRAPSGVRCGKAPVGSRDKWFYFSYTLLSVSVCDPKQTLGEP